ncbi:unnamed protein product [Didymodactylos carnosus]|uniref:Uncharacterized protein n=1 Tax=Didymodactylos carnosus TaxID=1234261 RepID=A0A815DRB8_9BILA|nr:unnamed protein product [Didymodactylos carnosus]CAF1374372.1 unnamed protein product [Didymodactylos carnosus]CAF4125572.1 unnamed protein product [Didymodactylos carnosus]CAF4183255.1 unnamed protein product [Didymodactylos carnosus]
MPLRFQMCTQSYTYNCGDNNDVTNEKDEDPNTALYITDDYMLLPGGKQDHMTDINTFMIVINNANPFFNPSQDVYDRPHVYSQTFKRHIAVVMVLWLRTAQSTGGKVTRNNYTWPFYNVCYSTAVLKFLYNPPRTNYTPSQHLPSFARDEYCLIHGMKLIDDKDYYLRNRLRGVFNQVKTSFTPMKRVVLEINEKNKAFPVKVDNNSNIYHQITIGVAKYGADLTNYSLCYSDQNNKWIDIETDDDIRYGLDFLRDPTTIPLKLVPKHPVSATAPSNGQDPGVKTTTASYISNPLVVALKGKHDQNTTAADSVSTKRKTIRFEFVFMSSNIIDIFDKQKSDNDWFKGYVIPLDLHRKLGDDDYKRIEFMMVTYRPRFPIWRVAHLETVTKWLLEANKQNLTEPPSDEVLNQYALAHQLITIDTNLKSFVTRMLIEMRTCTFCGNLSDLQNRLKTYEIHVFPQLKNYINVEMQPTIDGSEGQIAVDDGNNGF